MFDEKVLLARLLLQIVGKCTYPAGLLFLSEAVAVEVRKQFLGTR